MMDLCILLIHSLGTNKEVWKEVIESLDDSIKVLSLDLPMHGQNKLSPFSIENCVSYVAALLNEDCKYILVGMSVGGPVAIKVAAYLPEKISGLVLINSYSYLGLLNKQIVERTKSEISKAGLTKYAEAYANEALHPSAPLASFDYLIKTIGAFRESDFASICQETFTADVRAVVPNIKCPALIVYSDADQRVPPNRSIELYQQLKHATLEVLEESGHLPSLDQPVLLKRLLEIFVLSLEEPK